MRARPHLLALLLVVTAAAAPSAQTVPTSLPDRARAAEHVVVATVARVDPVFQRNRFGDELIVSRVLLLVEEHLKGSGAQNMVMEIEGGTIGDLTLDVSDLPVVRVGDRGVFFAARGESGALVPNQRGEGILLLDGSNKVKGRALTLDEIRAQVASAH